MEIKNMVKLIEESNDKRIVLLVNGEEVEIREHYLNHDGDIVLSL